MLHTIAAEDPGRTVVHVDGQGDGQGAFGKLEPLTLADRDLEMICNQVKLPASHLESRVCVNFHKAVNSTRFDLVAQGSNHKFGQNTDQFKPPKGMIGGGISNP
jgi:hypothetical protein